MAVGQSTPDRQRRNPNWESLTTSWPPCRVERRRPRKGSKRMDRPIALLASDEEVALHVRGFAVLRSAYEAEGYYDETAGGDPEEQDLYLVEVLDAPRAARAGEAMEGEPVWPLADLELAENSLRRLFPAVRWASRMAEPPPVVRYLLVLGHAL